MKGLFGVALLLQVAQGFRTRSAKKVSVAAQSADWLGWGRWVARGDYWHMQYPFGESLFNSDMPASCYTEIECRDANSFQSQQFNSVETWSEFYSSNLGLSIGGDVNGISGSISASLGIDITSEGTVSKRSSFASLMSQRACFRLVRDGYCAYNKSNLQSAFLERAAVLPQSDFSAENMEMWKIGFIQRFGTHMVVSSRHGAMVQSLASVDVRDEKAGSCLTGSLCLNFTWMQSANAELCGNTTSCSNSSSSTFEEKLTCVALGGEPTLQNQICQANATQQTIDAWLQGGDPMSGSSAYNYDFMPISEFLVNVDFMGFWNASRMLEKAVEYSNCRLGESPPVQIWDGSSCQCVRTCENGGILNEATCSCECPGDVRHGWDGPTCTEDYGSCQRGAGSSGTPSARMRACNNNNWCGGIERSETCSNAEVCCNRDEGGICCPSGSTCNCFAAGWRFCQCVPP